MLLLKKSVPGVHAFTITSAILGIVGLILTFFGLRKDTSPFIISTIVVDGLLITSPILQLVLFVEAKDSFNNQLEDSGSQRRIGFASGFVFLVLLFLASVGCGFFDIWWLVKRQCEKTRDEERFRYAYRTRKNEFSRV